MTPDPESPAASSLNSPAKETRHRRRWVVAGLLALGAVGLAAINGERLLALIGRDPHPDAERYLESHSDGVALADRFRSDQGLATAIDAMARAGYEDLTISRRAHPVSSRYPPLDRSTLVVEGYEHLGSSGRLSLSFLNDRLYQAEFEPVADAVQAYAAALRRRGLRAKASDNARIDVTDGHLRIHGTAALAATTMGRQLRTRPWIIWEDRRLIALRDEWDRRFGSIPKQIIED